MLLKSSLSGMYLFRMSLFLQISISFDFFVHSKDLYPGRYTGEYSLKYKN